MAWDEPIGRSDPGQLPDNHHSSGFTHRILARVNTGEPFEALQTGLRWFFTVDQGFEVWQGIRYKLQLEMAIGGMMVDAKTSDFDEPGGQDMQGEPAQELHSGEGYRISQFKPCPHAWDSDKAYPADCGV